MSLRSLDAYAKALHEAGKLPYEQLITYKKDLEAIKEDGEDAKKGRIERWVTVTTALLDIVAREEDRRMEEEIRNMHDADLNEMIERYVETRDAANTAPKATPVAEANDLAADQAVVESADLSTD